MPELPKLYKMLETALEQTMRECSMLLGHELAIKEPTASQVNKDVYTGGLENACCVITIDSQEEYQGRLYLVFALRDAIVLSGTLLGVPSTRILEKKRLAIFEEDDVDAFSEIANQVTGSFNSVFKPTLPRKVHLKQLALKEFVPQKDTVGAEEPIGDGDYYLLKAQLDMAGQDLESVELLIPLPLATLYDLQGIGTEEEPEEETSEETSEADTEVAAEPEMAVEQLPAVLILENNTAERQQFQEILAASGVQTVVAPLDADLKDMASLESIKAVLLGIATAGEQELSICTKITNHFEGIPIPIIVCAQQWTRINVLKALKHGARDILLKPCPADELASRVAKLMKAA